jgi:hypothetical protein
MGSRQKLEADKILVAGKLCHPQLFRQMAGWICEKKNAQVFFDIIDGHVYAV